MLKGSKRLFSFVLALSLLVRLSAAVPKTAQAVEIQAGLPIFVVGTTSATPTEVGFAGHVWQVIGYNGTGVASSPGTLTLLAKNRDWGNAQFNFSGTSGGFYVNNGYNNGPLHVAMQGIYPSIANAKEQALVQARSIDAKGEGTTAGSNPIETLDNQYFWPLSVAEANEVNSTVREFGDRWWLRSPGTTGPPLNPALVGFSGNVFAGGNAAFGNNAVRPAFNLILPSVLFTSAASGISSKSTATMGSGLVGATTPTGAVKMTVETTDTTFLSLTCTDTATRTVKAGDTVSIAYSGAHTAANKYVSCVITNNSGTVLFYGKLANAASGSASFIVPSAAQLPDGSYTIKLFNEECNLDNYTDFASAPVSIPMIVVNTEPQPPPSELPKTGDGFPMGMLVALMGAMLVGLGWMGYRMRKDKRA